MKKKDEKIKEQERKNIFTQAKFMNSTPNANNSLS